MFPPTVPYATRARRIDLPVGTWPLTSDRGERTVVLTRADAPRGACATLSTAASRLIVSCLSWLIWIAPRAEVVAWHTLAATEAIHALKGSASSGDFRSIARTA